MDEMVTFLSRRGLLAYGIKYLYSPVDTLRMMNPRAIFSLKARCSWRMISRMICSISVIPPLKSLVGQLYCAVTCPS